MKKSSFKNINWLQRGKLLAQLGQLELALDCFERSILLQEDQGRAKYAKHLILSELGRIDNHISL